jgi:hypothetical protein
MSDRFSDIFEAAQLKQQPDQVEPEPKPEPKPKPAKQAKQSKKQASIWDELVPEKEETKRLNLDIPASTDQKLAARAKKLKITKSALVRRLIDSYLENIE